MDSTDLTRDQAAQIGARIREAMLYVGALRERMDRRGYPSLRQEKLVHWQSGYLNAL